jgi:proliferating cell nuclear antigen
MFKVELHDSNIFKTIFKSISSIIDEVILECDEEGIRLRSLDRSHITFIQLNLKNELFTEYICDTPEKISIDTTELMKVLNRLKSKDVLGLTTDEGNLIITLAGDATRTFRIKLIDLEYETPQPPNMDYNTCIELPTGILTDAMADIEVFGDKITIRTDEDYIMFNNDGEFGDTEMKYLHGQSISETTRSVFALEKLKDIMKASSISDIIDLYLGDDKPLTIDFEIGNDEGKLSFLLAPRIDDSE